MFFKKWRGKRNLDRANREAERARRIAAEAERAAREAEAKAEKAMHDRVVAKQKRLKEIASKRKLKIRKG